MGGAAIGSDWVGRQVNERYPLLDWLDGTAGSGVFRTELSGTTGGKAAIKLIADDGTAEGRLAGWAIAKALPHPHLVRILDTGRAQVEGSAVVYLVTEYADEVLSEVLRERPLAPDEVRQMLPPVLEALSYLHGRGFVHGHVKPSNILVIGEQLKLSAEGQVPQHELQKRPALSVCDAPEIGSGEFSTPADVWSLGVTLVKALTQHAPEWARPARNDPAIPAEVPEPFAQIARECLRVNPAQRCTLDRVKILLEGQPAKPRHWASTVSAPPPAATAHPTIQPITPPTPVPPTAATPPPQPLPEAAPRPHPHTHLENRPEKSRLSVMPLVIVFIVLIGIIVVLYTRSHKAPSTTQPPPSSQSSPSEPPEGTAGRGGIAKGAVAKRVLPDVIPGASRSIRGTIVLAVRVDVDATGNVTSAELVTPGPSKYFARVALESARQWQFKPAAENGRAVASTWLLRYRFRNGGTEIEPKEEKP